MLSEQDPSANMQSQTMVPGSSVNARVPTDDDAIIVPADDAAITPTDAPPKALSTPHETSTEEVSPD